MDTPASPLVLTKLCVPAPRPRLVPRAHLVERLASETGAGLVLVCAPAGYGKTTLLAEWARQLQHNGSAVAWYALDASDNDPLPFGAYLVASLAQALGAASDLASIAKFLRAAPESDLSRIMPAILNAILASGRDCVLILDDYHLIDSPPIQHAVAFLLEHLPSNLRLVIGSRSDPPLPLARLRARGQLLELRTAGLCFTAAETDSFLNEVMQLDLSPELVAALESRTEGWIAGLQLAAIAMRLLPSSPSTTARSDQESFVASFTGGHRYLIDYLLQEVVSRQPEELQSFLLSTSILERLCAPLCDALLGQASGSQAVLEQLEQANLFVIPLDAQGRWYRYHHLFRDFLLARLRTAQPERLPRLYRLVSEWHTAYGSLRDAVQYALLTQDWEYTAALVEQHAVPMIMHSEFSTVYEWCVAFPEEVMQVHPALCLFQSNILALGCRRQNRSIVEKRLQQVEQAAAALDDQQFARLLLGQAAAARAVMFATLPDPALDPRQQFVLAQRALDLLSKDDPAQSAVALTVGYAHMALHDAQAAYQALADARQAALALQQYFLVVEVAFHQARLLYNQGQLRHAVEICRQGQSDISALLAYPEQELPALGGLDIALGCVLLEQDQLPAAEQRLIHGLDLIGWGMNQYQMAACVALFRLYEIQGRSAQALAFLSRLEEAWPDVAFCAQALRLTHALRIAPGAPTALAEAASWSQSFSLEFGEELPLAGMGPLGAAEAYYLACLAWVRIQIAAGNAQAALSYLERQLELAQAHGLVQRVVELSLLEAQAWRTQGDDPRTWVALDRALAAAQHVGFLRTFDQGPALNSLLVEAAERGICCGEYQKHLTQILGGIRRGEAVTLAPSVASAASFAPLPGQHLLSRNGGVLPPPEIAEPLSPRELEVLRLMARGASNQAIAGQLVITVGTVKSHINHILAKLGAHNRTEAVVQARDLGFLEDE